MSVERVTISLVDGQPYGDLVRECKRQLVQHALAAAGGDTKQAARTLGIARQNFYRLMKELGVTWRRASSAERVSAALNAMKDSSL